MPKIAEPMPKRWPSHGCRLQGPDPRKWVELRGLEPLGPHTARVKPSVLARIRRLMRFESSTSAAGFRTHL
jgi:hypothetical protein